MKPNIMRDCRCIILAAGMGTRMRSRWPKVLHHVAHQPMLAHVIAACRALEATRITLVLGPEVEQDAAIGRAIEACAAGCARVIQRERLGTAHAVLAARDSLTEFDGDVLILFGDSPLLTAETLYDLRQQHQKGGAAVTLLAMEPQDPARYGRLVTDSAGQVTRIVEYADASPEERAIGLCNGGIMILDGRHALALLEAIGNDNAQGEYYLTDIVALAREQGLAVGYSLAGEAEVMGVNARAELAVAEAEIQHRLRCKAMEAGVTLVAPETVFLSMDTQFGRDVILHPHVVIGTSVVIGDEVEIKSFSHLEGAEIASGASIGPYARLRPGSRIGMNARIGNFVETKAAEIGAGAKVSHLSYIGDATIGAESNIGAGTITCNYDGFGKYRTIIGADCFIGSNTALVAPVTLGDGVMIGAGSTITRDVSKDALAVTRAEQRNAEGAARRFRDRRARQKNQEGQ